MALLGAVAAARRVRRGMRPIFVGRSLVDQPSPLSMTARIDTPPGRWLWMVKWILALPHFLIVAGLWCAFIAVSLVAGAVILVQGRYPRRLFDFNVGVLRWTWRVGHYSYLSLGTDRYPPFTLDSTDFPADLEVTYPTSLARRLVLIKWLLAIPHLLIVAMIIGSTTIFGLAGDWSRGMPFGAGLLGVLIIVVAGHLVLRRSYPRGLFDLVIGLNRWVFRVVAYLALMTDHYPPFRLDLGGSEPQPVAPAVVTVAEAETRVMVGAGA